MTANVAPTGGRIVNCVQLGDQADPAGALSIVDITPFSGKICQ
jgi:hypothetical protein